MTPETCGLQAAGAGGDLPDEWHTLVRQQASTLAALLSRVQTTAATMRERQAPAVQVQALAAEAERVLTAQAQGQGNAAQDGCNEPDQRRRWRRPAVGAQGRLVLGAPPLSRDLSREGRHRMGLGTGDAPSARA